MMRIAAGGAKPLNRSVDKHRLIGHGVRIMRVHFEDHQLTLWRGETFGFRSATSDEIHIFAEGYEPIKTGFSGGVIG